ncbi:MULTISPECIES: cupin domain-containing protein [Prochlorococcus]|uniref:Uncharacterized double-stranded beta-helix domain containing conserved protein n=1 Tax=Prochlorococcus marinus (strain SARG / CCMP1375 / SS120) TaxID=167539 RepID=Q7VCT5_PROMA|nr:MULTISPECIES: cupin domain-containing protein [Prochlorococcus]AAP99699.1 Uncharacterized double-stranded beta-helix domain containing conserved protein [Prochlorococcus marinus subsp. marinus str. CCMP1375]KGG13405.1 hypothetical protein EV04_0640 [Prochlorococcus marinus str. LG]KGG21351.1 hypothetical protein EV08_0759 [Prochlorococcus marinus str. SS2]KGG24317.1 hypothetical protein EV09_0364 [Prochlorococcus marinus str. SS35]KGG33601.1 hypothetical protein EV10_0441 [Prochlorococcus m
MRRFLLFAITAGIAFPISACSQKKEISKNIDSVVVETLISATESWNGDTYKYPEGKAQMTLQKIVAQPGFQTDLHFHPQPGIAYVVRGTISCRTIDGTSLKVGPGESFATPQDTIHYCANDGDEAALIFVASAGAKGKKTTVPFSK